jgi:CBS domain-containing protein
MTPGPSTVRPSARLDAIANRMRDENLTRLLVTRSDGALVGVLRDVESARTGPAPNGAPGYEAHAEPDYRAQ